MIQRLFIAALVVAGSQTRQVPVAHADLAFTDQPGAAAGAFKWDGFASTYTGTRGPLASSGTGAAALTAGVVPPPSFAPPAQVFGGMLYTGSSKGRFTVDLSGADAAEANTTVVLQLAFADGSDPLPGTLLLGGAAPTEFVNRGIGSGDLRYYWAEWQLAAQSSYSIGFDTEPHFALQGAQLEYFNGAAMYDAIAGSAIPEPAAAALAATGAIALIVARRRRQSR